MKRHLPICLFAFLCLAGQSVAGLRDGDLEALMSILKARCGACHGAQEQHAGLRVDQLSSDFQDRDAALHWVEIRNAINLGEMPPADSEQLTVKEIELISSWVGRQMKEAQRGALRSDGRVLLRRLNRHEYTNTVSDLLQMTFPSGESPLDTLPPDGTAEGFDKVSAALLLDPSLMESYYEVARRIADRAIVDGPPEFPTRKMRLEFEDIAESRAIRYLTERLGLNPVEGGLELIEGSTRSFGLLNYPEQRGNNVAPVNGFYRFTLRASGRRGSDGEWPRLRVSHSHPDQKMQKVMEVEVTAPWDQPQDYTVVIPRDTLGGEVKVSIQNGTSLYMGQRPGENFRQRINEVGKQGDFSESIRLHGRQIAEGWGGDRSTPDPSRLDRSQFPAAFLDYLEVEGPLYDQWPPKSHTLLLFRSKPGDLATPVRSGGEAAPASDSSENQHQQLLYARQIFKRFLPKAWRRPIRESELQPVLKVVQTELGHDGSFHDAIRVGLTAALTSPKFLYLTEGVRADDSPPDHQPQPLTDFELASRLSYFLWNSMPDDELFDLAAANQLHSESVLRQQVDRMLADSRSRRFVESFARQWLRTDTFTLFAPDRYLYKDYDEDLGQAFVREPLEFFRTVLHDDLSVMNFLDSDFAVVNERLAQHYGLPGVEGKQFQMVPLPADSRRGGLLAMAGIHQAESDGVRTKPVARAVYVREVLFNNPPDPPPPNAGEIEPNVDGEKLTVRERLLQHQAIESCAICHRHLDPYGLALENFNVIGQWRDLQDGEKFRGSKRPQIDSSGRLPNGKEFRDFVEFRQLLATQASRFRLALVQKLLIYALGRPLEPSDNEMLNLATVRMQNEGDTLRSLLKSIITSKEFQTK